MMQLDPLRRLRESGPRRALLLASVLATSAVVAGPVHAALTETWVREGVSFRAGEFEGVQLTPDGELAARPERAELPLPEGSTLVWDVESSDGTVWVAAGEGLGLWRFPGEGEPAAVEGLGEAPEVFALEAGPEGGVYAATGPDGAVYRVTADGQASRVFDPEARYVWDLAVDGQGRLLVATGLPAAVERVPAGGGEAETLWSPGDPHVRCLTHDPGRGRIVAGTSGSGWVVSLKDGESPFVLWDSDRPEIVALEVAPDGALWVAAAGRPGEAQAGGTGEPPRAGAKPKGAKTSVVVRARANGDDAEGGEAKREGKPSDARGLPKGGGLVVRIARPGLARKVWQSNGDTPMALQTWGDTMLVAAGEPARIWWLDARGETGWWDVLKDRDVVTALAASGGRLLAATSHPASVLRYGTRPADPARWTSDVLDTEVGARFGRAHALVHSPGQAPVRVEARSGNTSEPNGGWSPWQEVGGAAGGAEATGGTMPVPEARFLQLRVSLGAGTEPGRGLVQRLVARYRRHNRPPAIDKMKVLPLGLAYRALPPAPERSGKDPVIDPVLRAELAEELSKNNNSWRPKKAYEPGALTVVWSAADPDEDQLVYRVDACRPRDGRPCGDATLLAEDLPREFFSFDSRALPDGVYRFRVRVDDAPTNHLGEHLTAERLSDPVVVDHTPPRFEAAAARRTGGGEALEVSVTGRDPGGRLVRAEVSVQPGVWHSIAPEDGVEDGESESFRGVVPQAPEAMPVVVRLIDRGGNVTTRRLPVE